MARKRYDIVCGCFGVALIVLMMLTEYAYKAYGGCIAAPSVTCASLYPPVACSVTACVAQDGGGFQCPVSVATDPSNNWSARCKPAPTGAMACITGGYGPVFCGDTYECSGCNLDETGTQVCQVSAAHIEEINDPSDQLTGGPCPKPGS